MVGMSGLGAGRQHKPASHSSKALGRHRPPPYKHGKSSAVFKPVKGGAVFALREQGFHPDKILQSKMQNKVLRGGHKI